MKKLKRKILHRRKALRATLGQRIKEARQKRGITQLELAHAIGYKGSRAGAFICRVENGSQEPLLDNLRRIAKALRVNLCWLVK